MHPDLLLELRARRPDRPLTRPGPPRQASDEAAGIAWAGLVTDFPGADTGVWTVQRVDDGVGPGRTLV